MEDHRMEDRKDLRTKLQIKIRRPAPKPYCKIWSRVLFWRTRSSGGFIAVRVGHMNPYYPGLWFILMFFCRVGMISPGAETGVMVYNGEKAFRRSRAPLRGGG